MKFLNHSQLRRNKKFHLALLLFAGISGILFFTFLKEKIIIIPSENISETKHWKTYSNSEFKFSFKYPEGLLSNFSEDVNGKNTGELLNLVKEIKIQNSKTSNSSYQYNVHFGADAWKYEGQLEEFVQTNLKETENLKRQKVKVSDYEGVRITNSKTESDVYFVYNLFKQGEFIYNFALFSDDPVLLDANLPLLENIISTVRFN